MANESQNGWNEYSKLVIAEFTLFIVLTQSR